MDFVILERSLYEASALGSSTDSAVLDSSALGASEAAAGSGSLPSEEVQRVRLSRRSCMIRVLSR